MGNRGDGLMVIPQHCGKLCNIQRSCWPRTMSSTHSGMLHKTIQISLSFSSAHYLFFLLQNILWDVLLASTPLSIHVSLKPMSPFFYFNSEGFNFILHLPWTRHSHTILNETRQVSSALMRNLYTQLYCLPARGILSTLHEGGCRDPEWLIQDFVGGLQFK